MTLGHRPVLCLTLAITAFLVTFMPYTVLNATVMTEPSRLSPQPHLFFCTHDFEHMDVYTALAQAAVWHRDTGIRTCFVMAAKMLNRLFAVQNRLRGQCVSVLTVRGGTVAKVLRLLEHMHVCVFIYRETTESGAYHIVRGWTGPIRLFRIGSMAQRCEDNLALPCLRKTYGHSYHVQYVPGNRGATLRLEAERVSAKAFVGLLKGELYPREERGGERADGHAAGPSQPPAVDAKCRRSRRTRARIGPPRSLPRRSLHTSPGD